MSGLYFSNIDWFDPDMRIDQWNAVAAAGKLCDGTDCDPKTYLSPIGIGASIVVTTLCPTLRSCDTKFRRRGSVVSHNEFSFLGGRYNKTNHPEQWRRFILRHRAQVLEVLTK